MLEKHNMMSINQINAQIKMTEIWKAVNDETHPFKIEVPKHKAEERVSRGQLSGYIQSKALTNITKKTFINDSVKAWNLAPHSLKMQTTLIGAKTAIKEFVKTLPI